MSHFYADGVSLAEMIFIFLVCLFITYLKDGVEWVFRRAARRLSERRDPLRVPVGEGEQP